MLAIWQDLRFGARVLRRNPGFTAVSILLLALGIGANSAIFSILDLILFKPLPYRDPGRLVMVWEKNPAFGEMFSSRVHAALRNYREWERRNRVFAETCTFQEVDFNLTRLARPERVEGARASPNFFTMLGVRARLGRVFTASEHGRVAVLTHGLHRRLFGGDPGVLGRTLVLNGNAYTVAGVLPPGFRLPAMREGTDYKKPELWVPFEIDPARRDAELNTNHHYVFARLKDGVSVAEARADMQAIAAALAREDRRNEGWGVSVFPFAVEDAGPGLRRNLLALQAAVGLVLLIACTNLASLLLARAASREHEMAVRAALGAGFGRLIRQLLCESLLLGLLGGLAGLGVALAGIHAVSSVASAELQRFEELRLDWRVFAFTFAASLVAGLACGWAPALYGVRRALSGSLRGARPGGRGRRALLAAEVALAVVLLAGAGLMLRSLATVMAVDPGFRADHVLTLSFSLPSSQYPKDEDTQTFCRRALEGIGSLPGVVSAALVNGLPMQNISMTHFLVEGQPAPRGEALFADYRSVTPDYFRTMGMPLLAGRAFTRHDTGKNGPVIVNESFARRFWPGRNAVGKALISPRGPAEWRAEVVGVVGDTRQFQLDTPIREEIFFPTEGGREMALAVRTAGPPLAMAGAVSAQIWRFDKNLPLFRIRTMDQYVRHSVAPRRFNAVVLGSFAALALALAGTGIYGVLAWSVSRRTREIGIRMALGADAKRVLRATVAEGLRPVALGMALGLAGAWALTRLIRGMLYGIEPGDPPTFAAVALVLAVVAALAAWAPARRATRVDPLAALRHG